MTISIAFQNPTLIEVKFYNSISKRLLDDVMTKTKNIKNNLRISS
jgi:hypothetical protein